MFEMTGKLSFALPMFASVLISKAVASKLSLSIFDSISLIRGLPFLDDLQTGYERLRSIINGTNRRTGLFH